MLGLKIPTKGRCFNLGPGKILSPVSELSFLQQHSCGPRLNGLKSLCYGKINSLAPSLILVPPITHPITVHKCHLIRISPFKDGFLTTCGPCERSDDRRRDGSGAEPQRLLTRAGLLVLLDQSRRLYVIKEKIELAMQTVIFR